MSSAMGRQRPGLVIEPPAFADLTADLCELPRSLKLTKATIAELGELSASDVSRVTSGTVLPTVEKVLAYVKACGGKVDEWEQRYRLVEAAVVQYRKDVWREFVDKDYRELSQPPTPYIFNVLLHKRIIRAKEELKTSQKKIAQAAHSSPQNVSNCLTSNLIAPASLVEGMLKAVRAEDEEIQTWLRWHRHLAGLPKPNGDGTPPSQPDGATPRPRKATRKAGKKGRNPNPGGALAMAMLALLASLSMRPLVADGGPKAPPPYFHAEPFASPQPSPSPTLSPRATPSPKVTSNATPAPAPPAASHPRSTPRTIQPTPAPQPKGAPATIVDPSGGHGNYLSPSGLRAGDKVYVICREVSGQDKGSYRTKDGEVIPPEYVKFKEVRPVIPDCIE